MNVTLKQFNGIQFPLGPFSKSFEKFYFCQRKNKYLFYYSPETSLLLEVVVDGAVMIFKKKYVVVQSLNCV